MRPVNFEESNAVLAAPNDMKDCEPLPVRKDGVEYVSCWYLSEDEIEQIRESRCVFLHVVSNFHPPVSLSVGIKEVGPIRVL